MVDTEKTGHVRESTGYNIGLEAMAGEVVNSPFVHLINFSASGQFSASNPPLLQAKNRYSYSGYYNYYR